MSSRIVVADAVVGLAAMPPESVQCVVTSPPYWGLRDYDVAGQLGLEATPREYLLAMLRVFREVRRVLRRDGTLWLNMGDCYIASPRGNAPGDLSSSSLTNPERQDRVARPRGATSRRNGRSNADEQLSPNRMPIEGLKPKDLVGMPWRLALALQRRGWWLRADIVWSKPNPMPESVRDRPTRSHEYLFLLTKSRRYYYDADAIREGHAPDTIERYGRAHAPYRAPGQPEQNGLCGFRPNASKPWPPVSGFASGPGSHDARDHNRASKEERYQRSRAGLSAPDYDERKWQERSDGRSRPPMTMVDRDYHPQGRNKRTVWEIATQPYPEAHFATFPEALVEPCILAGTSERRCPECGVPWVRVTAREFRPQADVAGSAALARDQSGLDSSSGWVGSLRGTTDVHTVAWRPGCGHDAKPVPCTVLDPFAGSGTVGLVAHRHGRDFVGIELNPAYAELARRRIHDDCPLFAAPVLEVLP